MQAATPGGYGSRARRPWNPAFKGRGVGLRATWLRAPSRDEPRQDFLAKEENVASGSRGPGFEDMRTTEPKVLVFASGSKTGGGSGFENLVRATLARPPVLEAHICGVVTNHEAGGVWQRAQALKIPCEYWPGPYDAPGYRRLIERFQADYVMLSGWLKLVTGLNPARTVNIHPGPLPRFGGPHMYGRRVHEAVLAAYRRGELTHSAVTMHFVDELYDHGPVFFAFPVPIEPQDTPETLAARVNRAEHEWQPRVLNYVVQGRVRLVAGEVVYESEDLKRLLLP